MRQCIERVYVLHLRTFNKKYMVFNFLKIFMENIYIFWNIPNTLY